MVALLIYCDERGGKFLSDCPKGHPRRAEGATGASAASPSLPTSPSLHFLSKSNGAYSLCYNSPGFAVFQAAGGPGFAIIPTIYPMQQYEYEYE